ncbi:Protein translocase subunit SecA, partial [Bienertia sinuspersici]
LEHQFNNLHLHNFPNCTAFCQQIKSLADQLANINHPLTDQKIVMRLIANLVNTDYENVVTILQQMDPLSSFNMARYRLLLEETRKASDSPHPLPQALVVSSKTTTSTTAPSSSFSSQPSRGGQTRGNQRDRGNYRGSGSLPWAQSLQ